MPLAPVGVMGQVPVPVPAVGLVAGLVAVLVVDPVDLVADLVPGLVPVVGLGRHNRLELSQPLL